MKNGLYYACQGFDYAIEEAKKAIISAVVANGGIVRTMPTDLSDYNFPIQAYFENGEYCSQPSNVYAVCYVEGEGIGILTGYGISNYRYDNDLETESEVEDFIDDVVKDVSYFEFMDSYDAPQFDRLNTIYNIAAGLGEFVDDEQ